MGSGWLWNAVYLLFLLVTTGVMLWWINNARVRRMKPYRLRGCAAEAWADERFLQCLERGFKISAELTRCFLPADTVMEIYLTMYPEHCTYDNLELKHLLQEFKQTYGWAPEDDDLAKWASWPLIDLFKTVSKPR